MESIIPQPKEIQAAKRVAVGRYWRKILGNMSDAVTVYEPSGDVVYANKMASVNLRYASAEQLMHKSAKDFSDRYMFFDKDGGLMNLEDMPSRRALREITEIEDTIHFVETQGTENFWLTVKAVPIVAHNRRVKFVVICCSDITALKEAEEMLRLSNLRIAKILDDLLKLD